MNMAPFIFCLILDERREAVMARSHLALAFGGWGGGETERSSRVAVPEKRANLISFDADVIGP